ncbi:cell division protein FtsA [Haloimpatiens lingqiaonensis]|uniref:cell division protein FtsA n=1 Tax=Haloimpatiens lingqiaonensis TaxID=1380675 RepID=UPI0010FDDE6A|nr:cell division protein FtsA [Haloimpatiens lingqiaonensis]
MNDYLVGIDIGFSKVCAAVGKLDKYGQINIIGVASAKNSGLKRSIVVDIDETANSIKECIEQLQRMIDIRIKDAYVSLAGEVCELIYNKGVVAVSSDEREIQKKDVDRAIESAKLINIPSDKEIVGIIPLQYIVDGYESIKDPIGMNGFRLEVESQIITTNTTVINNLIKSINRAGINISGLVLQPLALWQAVCDEEAGQLKNVIVDVGAENTRISIFKKGVLIKTEVVPLGGNNITNDISICLKIPYLDAEELKLKYGNLNVNGNEENKKLKINSQYGSNIEVDYVILNQIMKARVEEILLFVKKKLMDTDVYNEISDIVLVGGGISLFYGIEKLGREVFGKNIRIGTVDFTGADNPMYTAAVGIVKDVGYSLREAKNMQEENNVFEGKVSDRTRIKKDEDSFENGNKKFLTKIRDFLTDFF